MGERSGEEEEEEEEEEMNEDASEGDARDDRTSDGGESSGTLRKERESWSGECVYEDEAKVSCCSHFRSSAVSCAIPSSRTTSSRLRLFSSRRV